jgi:hypothetical protein
MEHLEYTISIVSNTGVRNIYLIVSETRNIQIFDITKDGFLTIKPKEDFGALADIVSIAFLHSIFRSMYKHILNQDLWNGTYMFSCKQPSLQEKISDDIVTLENTNLQKAVLQE